MLSHAIKHRSHIWLAISFAWDSHQWEVILQVIPLGIRTLKESIYHRVLSSSPDLDQTGDPPLGPLAFGLAMMDTNALMSKSSIQMYGSLEPLKSGRTPKVQCQKEKLSTTKTKIHSMTFYLICSA